MSYAERQIWIEIVSSSIVILLFVLVLSSQAQAGHFSGPDGFQTWARTVLMLIGAGIAVAIGVSIAFAIGHAIVTGERGSDRGARARRRLCRASDRRRGRTAIGLRAVRGQQRRGAPHHGPPGALGGPMQGVLEAKGFGNDQCRIFPEAVTCRRDRYGIFLRYFPVDLETCDLVGE